MSNGNEHAMADRSALERINTVVDSIVRLCRADSTLYPILLKFEVEQAADKAAYDRSGGTADKLAHMHHVLQRMGVFGLAVLDHILARTQAVFDKTRTSGGTGVATAFDSGADPTSPPGGSPHANMLHASSAEDFAEGTDVWLEVGAHLAAASCELLSLIPVVHSKLRPPLQNFLAENGAISCISRGLSVSTEQEVMFFQEGFKTEFTRLVANLSFENPFVCDVMVKQPGLLERVLCCTRVDVENPGMVEWAEFAIRNLCAGSPTAVEKIKEMRAYDLSSESKQMLDGKVNYTLDPSGKVQFSTLS